MKSNVLFAGILTFISLQSSYSQSSWIQKAMFGAGPTTEARAFSIGNFGYFGGPTAVLWRYDPTSDSWSQMAAFPGTTRLSPVAFSIGTKGYLGTGGNFNDFYEYDEPTNTWTQKANFGGSGREGALGIAINGKGYIGTGGNYLNDWWEYDPATNSWAQKANLAGPGRYHGGAFTVGGKGYICTGFNGAFFNDLWEYDPALNSWTSKAPLPSVTRDRPVGLATADRGYILTGWTGGTSLNDAWEYNPVTDSWLQLPSMPTAGRYNSCGFTIANKLYIGTGYMNGTTGDFWSYGPDCIAQTTQEPASCYGLCDGTAEVTFPDPGAVSGYLWSGGETTALVQGLCPGTYTVTVTDTTGCTSITSITIGSPPQITATANIVEPSCFGDSDGQICVVPGVSPATFLWAGGDTSACLNNVGAGTYMVTVTDSTGCSEMIPLTLTQPGVININFNSVNATCSACSNGSASAQTSGGTLPFSYSWSNGGTLAFTNNLLPGVYTCCVTDANGCMACDSVEILFTSGIDPVEGGTFVISPNPFTDNIYVYPNNYSEIPEISLFDISGRKLSVKYEMVRERITVNTSGIGYGYYILQLRSGEKNPARFLVLKMK